MNIQRPLIDLIILVPLALLLGVWVFQDEYRRSKQDIGETVMVRAELINNYLLLLSHKVESIGRNIELNFQQIPPGTTMLAELFSSIKNYPELNIWAIPAKFHDGNIIPQVGQLSGAGIKENITTLMRHEITAMMANDAALKSLMYDVDLVSSVYYLSTNQFIYGYPGGSVNDQHYKKEQLSKSYMTDADPNRNPSRKAIFTELYEDRYQRGKMITLSYPVYFQDQFIGVVAMDIGIRILRRLNQYGNTQGLSLLVDEYGKIVTRKSEFELGEDYNHELSKAQGWGASVNGFYWLREEVVPGQLTLLHKVSEKEIQWLVIKQSIFTWILIFAALVLWYLLVKLLITNQQIKRVMFHDSLTGLNNRRGFLSLIQPAKAIIERENEIWGLMLIDVDKFKSINDEHGHDVGDEVLKSVANVLSLECRETDVVSRWGGEEFLIFISKANPETVHLIASRFLTAINSLHHSSRHLSVNVSIGFASNLREPTFDGVFKRADEAMYSAKNAGGNRFQLHQ